MTATPFSLAHRPGAVLKAAALALAILVTALVGFPMATTLVLCLLGLGALSVGLTKNASRVAGVGALSLLGAIVVGGLSGAPIERLVPATAGVVLAWDFGIGALAIEHELGGGTVVRSELVHVLTATAAGALTTAIAYGVYRSVSVDLSVVGVALLLIAVTALGLGLRGW